MYKWMYDRLKKEYSKESKENLNWYARNPTGFRLWIVHVIPYSGHKYNFLTKFHINAQLFIRNFVEVMH